MFVSKSIGLAFQRPSTTGAASENTAADAATAPEWLRLERAGNVVSASMSGDGKSWTTVGSATVTLPGNVLVGVALTSHDDSALATASFDNVGSS